MRAICALFGVAVIAFLASMTPVVASDSAASLKSDLKKKLATQDIAGAMDAVDRLAALESKAGVDAICDYAFSADLHELERFTIKRLRKLESEGAAIRRVIELANKHKDPRTRLALCHVLEKRREDGAFTAIVQNVYDRSRSVQITALESIARVNSLTAVEPLIEALGFEEKSGRSAQLVAHEIRLTLTELTNLSFDIAADWHNYWKSHKDGFVKPAKRELGKGSTIVEKGPQFFDIEMNSDRLVFVLDVSGSMKKKDPLPEEVASKEKRRGVGTTVGGKKRKDPAPIPETRQRLARVQKELIRAISALDPKTQFDIITYSHLISQWKGSLVPATDRNRRAAVEFVREFKAEGLTHTDEALDLAFGYKDIDSIFLLSDGAPRRLVGTKDQLVPTAPILESVRAQNRFRRIRISTVTFEQCGGKLRKFMRELANENKGEYKELR